MTALQKSPIDTAIDRIGATGTRRNRRYQLPWLMLVGEPRSGRTSLAAGAHLRRPYGTPSRKEMEAEGWGVWLYDQGAVIDMPGLTEEPGPEFQGVLRDLRRVRGQRPIDGVLLTIPAHELMGPQALDDVGLDRKARALFQGLQSLRGELGVRFPIYVVITQCDVLPGFTAWCRSLPPSLREEMLGWSTPHPPQEPYISAWVNEAFASIHQGLCTMQLELFADGRGTAAERESAFLFPSQLRDMAEPVRRLLDGLFESSPYTEPALLRGIYFCGDPDAEGVLRPGRDGLREPRSPAFITQLLERKAFPESGLASPEAEALRKNRRQLTLLKAGLAASVLLGVLLILLGVFLGGSKSVLRGGDNAFLTPGERLVSANGRFALVYQDDGNLVIYDLTTQQARWATNTQGKRAWRTAMQRDGNLVVYQAANAPVWSSKTQGQEKSELVMRDDGILLIRGPDGRPRWTNQTGPVASASQYASQYAPKDKPKGTLYTVKPGDIIYDIAQRYLHDGNQWPRIVEANPGLNKDNLMPGQQIVIPQG
ncbi:type VI secretion protein IcmF/TssM N-terminal domain-containing protein [Vitiosangium sp. GDMCC 1.1324]|uniref:type VI secretion protein IcmF/TssM N-terminal domain-containing protein n=1 Tax=Vitiosangium sp. (strain GDMCC 1.1324) TaxID=2138576 RepID=UPI000D3D9261|nr:type VI secretion protein IcmF/TssM N-terminal domain-containing protein [Vitiosangium sp. GDMCC 1.1324]PTL82656.1 hypothetical protein DAT35_17860 [Vitiosangium sp. GDMCC 1.1324]